MRTLTDRFEGDSRDLEQFERLANSPVRSPAREAALRGWEDYKRRRTADGIRASTKGPVKKMSIRGQYIDLSGATFVDCCVGFANMRHVRLDDVEFTGNLNRTALRGCDFTGASMQRVGLREGVLREARLPGVDLRSAHLEGADLSFADLSWANLTDANLSGSDLTGANLVGANLSGADLTGCHVYGTSAWDVTVDSSTVQHSLVITEDGVTVDDIKIAQFIYLLLDNSYVRDVIETMTSKAVLILGRFTPERMEILNAVRDEVRRRRYLPMIFDFEKPRSQGYGQTVTLLARMSRYVIADITEATEVRSELIQIVPHLTRLPVQPILAANSSEYTTFESDIGEYPWVLPTFRYESKADVVSGIGESVIEPAETLWRKRNPH